MDAAAARGKGPRRQLDEEGMIHLLGSVEKEAESWRRT
jgi:hypothetical protein